MADIICKDITQDGTDSYNYVPNTDGRIIKDNYEFVYFPEYNIIKRIRENREGYFDFSKDMIDIGACYGGYSMLLDFHHNHAFEPNKAVCCLIYANMYLKDKVNNTTVYNTLLGDEVSTFQFDGFTCKDETMPENGFGLHDEIVDVESKMLDSFNLDNIGFIKVDVEGMEEKVLRGGIGTIIRNNYPPILFECWPIGLNSMTREKHDSLYNLLKSLGYEILEEWGDFDTHLAIHE